MADASERVARGLELIGAARTVDGATLLHPTWAEVRPGELVGVIGPSGAGKSTLLGLLAGLAPPSSGHVLLGGVEVHEELLASLRGRIGFVPQDDVVHLPLDVRTCLDYAARLRLPRATEAERALVVARVLREVALEQRADLAVGRLSGGQRKRVSIGVELTGAPEVLVLDEPTSGLDAATEKQLMALLRGLADAGRAVVLTTHATESLDALDQLWVLCDGRLVYGGAPLDAFSTFRIARWPELFVALERASPATWEARWRAQRAARGIVPRPIASADVAPRAAASYEDQSAQLRDLLRREVDLRVADRTNLALLLLQAPLIGLFVALAHSGEGLRDQLEIGFHLVLAAIWLGAINACREIVKERPIYLRERRAALELAPYLLSKLAVLTAMSSFQAVLLLATARAFLELAGDGLVQLAALVLTCVAGATLGLAISAASESTDRAVSAVPILLIPQAIFVAVDRSLEPSARVLESLTISRWGYGAFRAAVLERQSAAADLAMLGVFVLFFALLSVVALVHRDRPSS